MSNKTEMALASFRKPYSCAQTVYAAFASMLEPSKMEFMQQNSGGRAPENMCGALFAAMSLNPQKAEEIKQAFIQMNGDFRCGELKRTLKVSCEECVRTACQILENSQK